MFWLESALATPDVVKLVLKLMETGNSIDMMASSSLVRLVGTNSLLFSRIDIAGFNGTWL